MEIAAYCKNTEGLVTKIGRLDFILVLILIAFTAVNLDHTFISFQILFQVVLTLNLRRKYDILLTEKKISGENFPPDYFKISHFTTTNFLNLKFSFHLSKPLKSN